MSDFAPDESIARFETKSGFVLYWPGILFGVLAAAYAASFVTGAAAGRLSRTDGQLLALVGGVALVVLGVVGRLNWRRVKWVRTAGRGGIQWYACGRVWHREWVQLVRVHTHATILVDDDGNETVVGHTTTVGFGDGAGFRVGVTEFPEYKTLARYLVAKHEQARATVRNARNAAARARGERTAADKVTTFGPLGIYRGGIEWDGIYYPWEKIEGYEIQHGILIVRSVDGDEFLRRTADLGDWRTAVERLEAATRQMAGRRAATGR
jgi:hypothetical protein